MTDADGLLSPEEVEAVLAETRRMTAGVQIDFELLERWSPRCQACGAALVDARTGRRRFCDSTCRVRFWRARRRARLPSDDVPKATGSGMADEALA